MSSSPAICPVCNQISFAIAIPEVSATIKKRFQDPEYQAKLGAIRKKRWQDPEYRAHQMAARNQIQTKAGG